MEIEYSPEGEKFTEMMLVDMLAESRSWSDYNRIANALSNIRKVAKDLKAEHKHLNPGTHTGPTTSS